MKTVEERIKIAKELSGNDLWKAYEYHNWSFDPLDDYKCESCKIIKDEIMRRLIEANPNAEDKL